MDTYQPIYDAVRSKLSHGDIGEAVQSVLRNVDFNHYVAQAMGSIQQAAQEFERPSVMFRPRMSLDGNQWCALYGEDLQEGVAGFGDSPTLAMQAFDKAWYTKISAQFSPR